MTTKAKSSAKASYSSFLATAVTDSRTAGSTGKTITHLVTKSDDLIELWSFADEPHSLTIGTRALLTRVTMPDGKVFINLG